MEMTVNDLIDGDLSSLFCRYNNNPSMVYRRRDNIFRIDENKSSTSIFGLQMKQTGFHCSALRVRK